MPNHPAAFFTTFFWHWRFSLYQPTIGPSATSYFLHHLICSLLTKLFAILSLFILVCGAQHGQNYYFWEIWYMRWIDFKSNVFWKCPMICLLWASVRGTTKCTRRWHKWLQYNAFRRNYVFRPKLIFSRWNRSKKQLKRFTEWVNFVQLYFIMYCNNLLDEINLCFSFTLYIWNWHDRPQLSRLSGRPGSFGSERKGLIALFLI